MTNDNVLKLIQPGSFDDKLTEILTGRADPAGSSRRGRVADFLAKHADLRTEVATNALRATAIRLSERS